MRPFLIAAAFLLILVLPQGKLEAQIAERGWNDSYRENIDEEYFGLGRRDSLTGQYQAPYDRRHRRAPWSPWDRRRGFFVVSPGGIPAWIWVQTQV
jgi:hypothetical protein